MKMIRKKKSGRYLGLDIPWSSGKDKKRPLDPIA